MSPPDTNLDPDLRRRLEGVREADWRPILSLGAVVLFVWLAGFVPWLLQERNWPWNLDFGLENAGVFGDSFGFINSLMSSLALVGVIAAIWLQKQELVEQRKELIITQWELRKAAEAQQASQRELAKQAKINHQATILTALQGIEQAAGNPVLYAQDEGKDTALFVNQLRQLLVVDILDGDGDAHAVTQELSGKLTRWRDLTFIMSTCREMPRWIKRILSDGTDLTTGQRRIKTRPEDIDRPEYRMLLLRLASKLEKLERAMSDCGQSADTICEWVATAQKKYDQGDKGDLIDRLKSLSAECEKRADDAMYQRAGMFE
jgi:hypothetical protein